MLSRKCPRPTRRIKTLRRRRLALGQTITVPDTPGSQRSVAQHGTGADDTPSLPYIGVLSDAHSAAHTPRVSTARYANVVPAHASGTERHVGSRRLLVDQLLDGPSRSMQPREKETTGNPTRCLFCILWIPHATSNATLCLLPASDDLE